jgi:predicted DCC family thiol-disulfide oxidoreductase YuxK
MRIAWAATVLSTVLPKLHDMTRYFSDAGFLPPEGMGSGGFSLFNVFHSPFGVHVLACVLTISAVFTLLGILPRLSTIVTFVLLTSLHERSFLMFAGGDTVLRLLGFLIAISPGIGACSLARLWKQWKHWHAHGRLMSVVTMPAWPRSLLLWQLIVIYVTSAWAKLLTPIWVSGTAIAITLHHPELSGIPRTIADMIAPLSPFIGAFLIAWEICWLGFLIPAAIRLRGRTRCRRIFLGIGVLFHLAIFLFTDVGVFAPAMLCAYLGILKDEDIADMRAWWNAKMQHGVTVLFDGQCGLCDRAVFIITAADALRRVTFVDYHDHTAATRIAPNATKADLARSMHVRFPDGTVLDGFDAYRRLCWHIPWFWALLPFLYLPGITPIGRMIYRFVAAHRPPACPVRPRR